MFDRLATTKRGLKSQLLQYKTYLEAWRFASKTDEKRVVFLGDSRTRAWPPIAIGEQVRYFNRGIGYNMSWQTASRLNRHVALLNPHVVLVQIGVNDFRSILLQPAKKTEIIQACQANIELIVKRLENMGAHVILTTIFPVARQEDAASGDFWWIDQQDITSHDKLESTIAATVTAAITETNQHIRELAGAACTVMDAWQILCVADGYIDHKFMEDALHLNEYGYAALNQHLEPILKQIMSVPYG
ncbi:SGNH/GDSL hydrolase family protein [Chloroflexi bacterium TSY]|nr:SGNH/GDSL hydrolase family protein [Chloroflexi bacterium TSY]